MTADNLAPLRERLYSTYVSDHAGQAESSHAAVLAYRRDIRPALPTRPDGLVLDIGCGQGELVRLMRADGYNAEGVDVSHEQVAIAHAAGLQYVREARYQDILLDRSGQLSAVVATDVLEHLTKEEVLESFDLVAGALAPGGVFIARVPNAVSPFGGYIRHGDFTHETWFTECNVRQLAAAAGFAACRIRACPPQVYSPTSALRLMLWKGISIAYRLALGAETGDLRTHIVTQNLTFVAKK